MELRPPLYLGVVAIEKGAFGSLSTKIANLTYSEIIITDYKSPQVSRCNVTTPNRSLHHSGSQQTLLVLRPYIDIFSTMVQTDL